MQVGGGGAGVGGAVRAHKGPGRLLVVRASPVLPGPAAYGSRSLRFALPCPDPAGGLPALLTRPDPSPPVHSACCRTKLFSSGAKVESESGWPTFTEVI
eukprot:CAMPEP_0182862436 /NCGR_PEP_ID=MMETSP0034_2-20130328/6064_1 /TAXON_ID=156128 /ORGANISM="Nephroselmis pyriformis, Strain CCMP717" /LENGTH=98 /DNA_ID=CAMNT_0024994497 /DNA_START=1 /DNA_END=294 /DNA_ORIENTATION=-